MEKSTARAKPYSVRPFTTKSTVKAKIKTPGTAKIRRQTKLRALSLPNEVLLDIFRWLDRQTLELGVRPVSRRADALVRALPGHYPRLCIRSFSMYLDKDFVCCYVNIQRNPRECHRIRDAESTPPAKPFTVFDVSQLPPYLFFGCCSIDRNYVSLIEYNGKTLLEDTLVRRLDRAGDIDCVAFKAKYPLDGMDEKSLHEYSWGKEYPSCSFEKILRKSWVFDTRYMRTCITTRFTLQNSGTITSRDAVPIVHRIMDWLLTPEEASVWNPQPTTIAKHLVLDRLDSEKLLKLLIKRFARFTQPPCHFHITVDQMESPQKPDQLWTNETTGQTLRMSHRLETRHLWCRRTETSTDFCRPCPYYITRRRRKFSKDLDYHIVAKPKNMR